MSDNNGTLTLEDGIDNTSSCKNNSLSNNNDSNNDNDNDHLSNNQEKKKNGKKWLLLILFIVLFMVCGLFAVKIWQLQNNTGYWFDELAKDGVLEGRTPEEIQAILNQVVEEGMFNVAINPDPIFEDGKSEGNIAIENVPGNHYYSRVSIVLDETNEIVFKSAGIKPGQYIDYIKLDKNLPKGDYPATAYFEVTDPKTFTKIGSIATEITIHILN